MRLPLCPSAFPINAHGGPQTGVHRALQNVPSGVFFPGLLGEVWHDLRWRHPGEPERRGEPAVTDSISLSLSLQAHVHMYTLSKVYPFASLNGRADLDFSKLIFLTVF